MLRMPCCMYYAVTSMERRRGVYAELPSAAASRHVQLYAHLTPLSPLALCSSVECVLLVRHAMSSTPTSAPTRRVCPIPWHRHGRTPARGCQGRTRAWLALGRSERAAAMAERCDSLRRQRPLPPHSPMCGLLPLCLTAMSALRILSEEADIISRRPQCAHPARVDVERHALACVGD